MPIQCQKYIALIIYYLNILNCGNCSSMIQQVSANDTPFDMDENFNAKYFLR